jgi:hypothetical protein
MSESDVGLRPAVTLQKAGRRGNDMVLPGGVKEPLSIIFASVIETVGETSFERLSQDSAWGAVGKKAPPRTIIESISFRAMIRKYIYCHVAEAAVFRYFCSSSFSFSAAF